MTTLPDLLYVASLAVALPLIDYFVFWPAFRRRSETDPARARRWLWAWSIGSAWPLVGVGATLWMASDRSWTSFGFSVLDGWRLWTAIAMFLLLVTYHVLAVATLVRSSEARASVRSQFFGSVAAVVPHTRTELSWFAGMALTAGFCEEFLYRGYVISVLSPWLGWWGAAALSLAIFAVGHVYQGWTGVLRTGIVGAFFTLVVALLDSLWPAIALHVLQDLGGGAMAWLALREEAAHGGPAVDGRTEPQRTTVESSLVKPEPPAHPTVGRSGRRSVDR